MAGPLVTNPMGKWLEVIRRGTYQVASGDVSWAYEPVCHLWPDVEPDSDSSNEGSSD